jgi:hypothetical protein
MILLLAGVALADPVAQRAPTDGDVDVVLGAPLLGIGVRLAAGEPEGRPAVRVSASVRLPSASTDVSAGLSWEGGPGAREDRGWAWAAGASAGLIGVRGPSVALSLAPWARVERRGRVHGGAQVAVPVALHLRDGARLPVLGELFIGGGSERVHVVALGGAGWAWTTGTPAGSLVLHGSVQVGWRR